MTSKFRIREENNGNAYLNIYEHSNNKFSYEITFETEHDNITHSISKQYENGFECCIEGYKELSGLNDTKQLKSKTLCECGGNERIALDCTMKPCKHPKYYKTKSVAEWGLTKDDVLYKNNGVIKFIHKDLNIKKDDILIFRCERLTVKRIEKTNSVFGHGFYTFKAEYYL